MASLLSDVADVFSFISPDISAATGEHHMMRRARRTGDHVILIIIIIKILWFLTPTGLYMLMLMYAGSVISISM